MAWVPLLVVGLHAPVAVHALSLGLLAPVGNGLHAFFTPV